MTLTVFNINWSSATGSHLLVVTAGNGLSPAKAPGKQYAVMADGRYLIQLCRHTGPLELTSHGISAEDPMLIRGRLQSRHQNSTNYFIYILVDVEKSDVEAVVEYTCQCKNGLRTVGCCAHILAVLWYLGYGRHQPEIPLPAAS